MGRIEDFELETERVMPKERRSQGMKEPTNAFDHGVPRRTDSTGTGR